MFNKAGIEVVVTPTKEARHAFEMARTLPIADYDAMVVIGGDGTIHEVLNGMLARDDGATVPVGLIPQGTGNSMAMDYKYVVNLEDPEEAVRVIIGGFAPSSDLNLVTFGPHPTGKLPTKKKTKTKTKIQYNSPVFSLNIEHLIRCAAPACD